MIVIAGGGLSGLSAAYYLKKSGIDCLVLEASERPGGCIASTVTDQYLLESGPHSLLYSPYLQSLVEALGITQEVQPAAAVNKNRYIFKNGKYRKLPSNPLQLFFGDFFSWQTKLKVVGELFRKPGSSGHVFLQTFFEDHFGQEIAAYALNPFISGIYAGDPERLLVEETFPSLIKFEKENGSILKGMIKNAGARKKLINFKHGMQTLTDALAAKSDVQYNSTITQLKKISSGYVLEYAQEGTIKKAEATAVVLSLPATAMKGMLGQEFPQFSSALAQVNYAPMTLVYTAYKKKNVGHALDGFGGLHAKKEQMFSAGSIWTSSVFPGRCPQDEVLFTSFVGGEQYKEQAVLPDQEILDKVNAELKKNFQITSVPVFQKIKRWSQALPQYDVNILPVKKEAVSLEKSGIYICSNVLNGVSMEDCIRKGEEISKKIENSGIR